MTPAVVSKVSPQLGSCICSFLVNSTSEMSTPESPGDNFDPLMALPASFLLPGVGRTGKSHIPLYIEIEDIAQDFLEDLLLSDGKNVGK